MAYQNTTRIKKADRFSRTGEIVITFLITALAMLFATTLAGYLKEVLTSIKINLYGIVIDTTIVFLLILLVIIMIMVYVGVVMEKASRR